MGWLGLEWLVATGPFQDQFSLWLSVTLVVVGVLNGGVGTLILRTRSNQTAMPVFISLSGIAVWTVSQGLLLAASTNTLAYIFTTTMHVGAMVGVTGALHFSLSYASRNDWLRLRRLGVIYGVSGLWILLFVTNPLHELLYVPSSHAGAIVPIRDALKPLYFLYLLNSYALTSGAMALMGIEYWNAERGSVYSKQAGLIVFALFIPFFPNMLAYSGVTDLNYSHWAFGATGLLIATSLYRYQWLDLVPVGRGQVIEQIRDGYLVIDSQRRVVDSNPSARAFLDVDEVVGSSVADVFPDCLPLLSGEETELQLTLGSAVVTVSRSPITTDSGEGHLLLLRDVTEQRRTERRFRALIENISDVITVVDYDGTVTYESPSIETVLGYERGELLDTQTLDRVHPEDREDASERLANLAANPGQRERFEYRVRHADGSWRTLEGVATNPEDDDLIDGIILVSRDVTDRRQRERELEQSNERLEQFAGVVSHDLRNPLNVIAGRAELAMETDDEEHIEQITTAADRMETIIEDLLVLSRSGQTVDDPSRVSLAAVAAESWETVQATNATLEQTIPEDVHVEADRDRLLNVFENLYRNSLEHGRPADGDGHLTIRVGLLADDGTEFYVEDDGQGIPAEERDQVFNHGYSTHDSGTGFGLSIVQDILTAHGWDVTVTDSTEGGARFEITTDPPEAELPPTKSS
ncbi:histidine kinase N-terminal 7TM domain-containing protein [Halovenus halobia]|uniref:histidine kinase N-terminal 7TM domain-containing protein n=1 Tax=Halovenus halobia TaxID=3396622 RepID=UPI003F54333E